MLTWGQLKTDLRAILWPQGEAVNLVIPHNADFLDAIIDLQESVVCLQVDNTNLFPQCATFYNCGLTVLDSPGRGGDTLVKVSVVDKKAGQDDVSLLDWCSERPYTQIDACHIHRYLGLSRRCGGCFPVAPFFGFGWRDCGWERPPVPTNAGLPAGLPSLPLGFAYPQTSTDRPHRARRGVWAIERGKIWVAPWIQSTETVVVMWDGTKRTWADGDPVDNDPNLLKAIREYVRWKHCDHWEKDEAEAMRAEQAYVRARAWLIHQCRMGTLVRDCRPSQARSSVQSLVALFYNDEQTAQASCPAGQTGDPVSVTIQAGTIASNVSVADANQKAQAQALQMAQAQLVCTTPPVTYWNTVQQYTASCQQQPGAPAPDGDSQTSIVAAGKYSSTISQDDANQQAYAAAQVDALSKLSCTFWNREQTQTATCPSNPLVTATKTVAAHTFSSSGVGSSQEDADNQAKVDALNQATAAVAADPACSGGGGTVYWNTVVYGAGSASAFKGGVLCFVSVTLTFAPHQISSADSTGDANNRAQQRANQLATDFAHTYLALGQCGPHAVNYP